MISDEILHPHCRSNRRYELDAGEPQQRINLMSLPDQKIQFMTVEEYLSFEESSAVRHEYLDGQVFAMSGTSLRHNIIAENFHAILKSNLKGSPCKAFLLEVKVKIDSLNSFYYPDVVVSCTPMNTEAIFLESPVLIAEILSPSTAAIDRREKLLSYGRISSVREYIIIHQSTKRIEIFSKGDEPRFSASAVCLSGSFRLHSLPGAPVSVDIESVYEEVDWDQQADAAGILREDAEIYTW